MDPDTVTLTQRPQPLSIEDYEVGRGRLVDQFSGRKGVIGIYDYGTVEHPGISDLDVMLVFDPEVHPEWIDSLSASFDPLVDELVGRGNIIVLDRDTFEHIHHIDPYLTPRHLAGQDIPRESVDEKTASYRNYASIMDWLPERVYQVERLRREKEIPVMRALQLLKSLGYSLRILDDSIEYERGVAFAEDVRELRACWFERTASTRKKALLEAIEEACNVGRRALRTWFEARPPGVFAEPDGEVAPGLLSYFDGIVYSAGESGITERDGWIKIGIPGPWFDHYRVYATHGSELGHLIRQSMVSDRASPTALTEDYSSYLEVKMTVCADNFEWVRRLSLDSGAFRFGFLLGRADWTAEAFNSLRSQLELLISSNTT